MTNNTRKALIFGKNGQLSWELQRTAPNDFEVLALGSAEIDLLDRLAVQKAVDSFSPDLVINAAAYTAVDKAESDEQGAFELNQHAVANILDAVESRTGTKLIHVSTDFVFDGKTSEPYRTDDQINPLSVYGSSKAAGESEIISRNLPGSLIVRTSWVYSVHGANFVKTMLRLMADENREQLNVVADQIGTPTWAYSLARALWCAGVQELTKPGKTARIYHWTDAGVASWYDFAVAIQEIGLEQGLLNHQVDVNPITQSMYPTPATRPTFSVMDKSAFEDNYSVQTRHWRSQLKYMLRELLADIS
ncbi:dTDP-4-dehydrorhamnose reductase [Microbulbifer agarilyticus]|uniref:dTDP-4-dehydrorhamnose reductase n=1 Tax=Microbulbifer agarilyticus TaxID=260552 RepID=UPI001CD59DA8|nr:dTDP-4-dehydrorhamnose reductase [Microbulbifer agarilyticus]MCA0893717.1 dTDP-4-dehydrorhamnose reductase [Microbulbifer agarilyticus]